MDGRFLPQDPIPDRTVTVFVPGKASYDLGAMQKITAQVLGRLGCENCHSGHHIHFEEITRFAVDADSLEVREIYGSPGG